MTAITSLPSLVSSNFTWEKVGTVDIGLDFSMFSNRFTGTFDWYQRNTNGNAGSGHAVAGRSRCERSLSEYSRYAYTWLGIEV